AGSLRPAGRFLAIHRSKCRSAPSLFFKPGKVSVLILRHQNLAASVLQFQRVSEPYSDYLVSERRRYGQWHKGRHMKPKILLFVSLAALALALTLPALASSPADELFAKRFITYKAKKKISSL